MFTLAVSAFPFNKLTISIFLFILTRKAFLGNVPATGGTKKKKIWQKLIIVCLFV